MIEPKTVIIRKENQIKEGWRLLSPTSFLIDPNPFFEAPSLNDVRKAITYADSIHLSLAEAILSRSIVDELIWVNKYAPIEIEAKDKSIISHYSSLKFSKESVDPNLSTNILIAKGNKPRILMIGDSFSDIDAQSYEKPNLLDGVVEAFCFGKGCAKDPAFTELHKSVIKINWILSASSYQKEDHIFATENQIHLFISAECKEAIILKKLNGALLRIIRLSNGKLCLAPIEKLSHFSSDIYRPNAEAGIIMSASIQDEVYYCDKGTIAKLHIKDVLEIETVVQISTMDDFISSKFDSSIVEAHNQYSRDAKYIDYRFILTPPMADDTCVESKIYEPIKALVGKWEKAQTLSLSAIKEGFVAICPQGGPLIELIDGIALFSKDIKSCVLHCDYRAYYPKVNEVVGRLSEYEETIMEALAQAYSSITNESSGSRFFKFDSEIEGYKATIAEKTNLISQGIDVLSNKRRIEILTQKINDLIQLKERFQQSSPAVVEKALQSFLSDCARLLKGATLPIVTSDSESIGKVLATKEETKEAKLKTFVRRYLPLMAPYFETCLAIAKDLALVRIPQAWKVVDRNGKPSLVIETESDFEQSKQIRQELGLECLAKR